MRGFRLGARAKRARSYPNDRRKQKQELAVAHLTMLIERDAMLIQLVWVAVAFVVHETALSRDYVITGLKQQDEPLRDYRRATRASTKPMPAAMAAACSGLRRMLASSLSYCS